MSHWSFAVIKVAGFSYYLRLKRRARPPSRFSALRRMKNQNAHIGDSTQVDGRARLATEIPARKKYRSTHCGTIFRKRYLSRSSTLRVGSTDSKVTHSFEASKGYGARTARRLVRF